jgi:hypothetical protein
MHASVLRIVSESEFYIILSQMYTDLKVSCNSVK